MNDFAPGVDDGNEAIDIYYEMTALMKIIKLRIAKWATSCEELKEIWKTECQGIQKTTQALGLDWNTDSETLSLNSRNILDKTTKGLATKRQTLETTARFYGPLGLFCLFPLSGR